ncbi:FG-GAP repeat domain-containing protein [Hyphobacterium sp.]|uniref:FG-GAP repeat domain-containing protein n=1 Tax=Hyphobacterium sp. TaxID=2004662 RepID=UPI00374A2C1C
MRNNSLSAILLAGVAACAVTPEVTDQTQPISFDVHAIPASEGVAGGVNVVRPGGNASTAIHFAQAQSSPNLAFRVEEPELVAAGHPAGSPASTSGLCYGDGDGDGLLDELEANQHGEASILRPGDGSSGLSLPGGDNYHCSWADTDGDGLQEAYLFDVQGNARVIAFSADGFVVVEDHARFPWTREAWSSGGGSFADVDRDGDPDLLITSPAGADRLYLNTAGVFTRPTAECDLLTDAGMSGGASFGDLDNDGDPDLFVARLDGPDRLYRNDDGCFLRVENEALAERAFQSWSAVWTDMDRDGDLDLIVSQYDGPIQIYENRHGQLIAGPEYAGFAENNAESRASGLAALDIDFDGDEDIIAAMWDGLPNAVLTNTTDTNLPSVMVLAITEAGAPLLGAQIHAGAEGRYFYRELEGTTGLRSQSAPAILLHSGLDQPLDWLEVRYHGEVLTRIENVSLPSIVVAEYPRD